MSLIVSQTGVNRLPAELVNNAAFVKYVDFDPVHQTADSNQPAEKVSGIAGRFDTISISPEALAKVKDINTGANISQSFKQEPKVIDITDPVSAERRKQSDAMGRAMKSWNAAVEQMKQISESSSAYGYGETVKLFKKGYADWQANLRDSDPEAYGAWLRMLKVEK